MTRRTSPWPAGLPCWLDLGSTDLAAVKDVYAGIFGWELLDSGPEFGGYVNALLDGAQAAGMMPVADPHQPSGWLLYLASDDADATAQAINAAGGTVVFGPTDIRPTGGDGRTGADLVGRMLVAVDPTGARFGVWQHGTHIGAEVVNEPGSLMWEHLHTQDEDSAQAFYGIVFGWHFDPMPGGGGGVTFTDAPGQPPLGSLGRVNDEPAQWVVHLACTDADAAVEAVVGAGGRVVVEPDDTPWGRLAVVEDVTGARLAVMATPADAPRPDRSG